MLNGQHKKALGVVLFAVATVGSLTLYGLTPAFQRGLRDQSSPSSPSLQTGPYYALIIGNNNYRYVQKLVTPNHDANEIAQLLHDRYGFQTQVLLDADRNRILTALVNYRKELPPNSNLLIYYAGHGHHDRDADEAYWLPVDAQAGNNANWISADDITSDVRAIPSAHILIISDSCYSGYLKGRRTINPAINPLERQAFLSKMLSSKSRNLMSSGRDEPVLDTGGLGHSVFAAALLDSLRKIDDDSFTATDLFDRFIQPQVGGRSDQLPLYSFILNSGHEYGDFVFSRSGASKEGGTGKRVSNGASTGLAANGLSRPSGIAGWAVGKNGTILHTQDGGHTWGPQHSGTDVELDSVAFASPRSGWVVGEKGTILHTDDGGGSWKPQDAGTSADLSSVFFSNSKVGWVAGSRGRIWHTEDGGDNWKPQNTGDDHDIYSIAFPTSLSGWVVGASGKILHTDDGGRTWKQQDSGNDYFHNVFVTFADTQSGWVIENTRLLHTEDGGHSWKHQKIEDITRVAFDSPKSAWAVGSDGDIWHTEDGGDNWTRQDSVTSEWLICIAFATPQSGLVVGVYGTVLHTENAGNSWKSLVRGTPDLILRDAVFLKPPSSGRAK